MFLKLKELTNKLRPTRLTGDHVAVILLITFVLFVGTIATKNSISKKQDYVVQPITHSDSIVPTLPKLETLTVVSVYNDGRVLLSNGEVHETKDLGSIDDTFTVGTHVTYRISMSDWNKKFGIYDDGKTTCKFSADCNNQVIKLTHDQCTKDYVCCDLGDTHEVLPSDNCNTARTTINKDAYKIYTDELDNYNKIVKTLKNMLEDYKKKFENHEYFDTKEFEKKYNNMQRDARQLCIDSANKWNDYQSISAKLNNSPQPTDAALQNQIKTCKSKHDTITL